MFIAEQQMAATALGMQARGWLPFAATFAAFWARAYDFIRMAAISRANLKLIGTHAGVSIGQDGPSQMGLEDLAMFRAVHGSVVLYPCDANQAAALTAGLLGHYGIGYLRVTRGDTPVIYQPGDQFPIGGSRQDRKGLARSMMRSFPRCSAYLYGMHALAFCRFDSMPIMPKYTWG